MSSELILYLFYDNDYPLALPAPYEVVAVGEERSVCLAECEDMAELNHELALACSRLPKVRGSDLILSVYRREDRARADDGAVYLGCEMLRQMAACAIGVDYCLYVSRWRSSRFRQAGSFFLLTFPQGIAVHDLPEDVPFLYAGEYSGQYFVLTLCTMALAAYLAHVASKGCHVPALRVDYFSEGSAVMWYLEADDEIRSLAALGCSLELRIHPAMLLHKEDAVFSLFRYLMRSPGWRKCLIPPAEEEEAEACK